MRLPDAEPGAEQLISTEQGGYRLRIDLDTVDAVRFQASIETARRRLAERDPVGAAATLQEGLATWLGDAYGEFRYEEWAQLEVSRLEELKTRLCPTNRHPWPEKDVVLWAKRHTGPTIAV